MQITKNELNEMIKKAVKVKLNEMNRDFYDRMSGIVDQRQEKEFTKVAIKMIRNFENEGFESTEIFDYFARIIGEYVR